MSRTILYKYAGAHGLRILQDLKLKVSPPDQFNDPFEITPRSKFTQSLNYFLNKVRSEPESLRPVYEMMVKNESFPFSFEKFISALPRILPQKHNETAKQIRKLLIELDLASLKQASQHLGVLCLAKNKSSICMWGHYGNDHKGMAIGLDFSVKSPKISVAHGLVRYRRARCRINRLHRAGGLEWMREAGNLVFTKSNVWKYEREYRYVVPLAELSFDGKSHIHFLHIDSMMIAEVIFGCCASEEDVQFVRYLKTRKPRTYGHIQLFRCKRDSSQFKLNIVSC